MVTISVALVQIQGSVATFQSQRLGLQDRQPVPNPHAFGLDAFDARDSGVQFRSQQTVCQPLRPRVYELP